MREYHPPVLDLHDVCSNTVTPDALKAAASQFDAAMRAHGVLYIENCGVSDLLVSTLRRQAFEYFHAAKMDKSDSEVYGAEGYTAIGRETVETSRTKHVSPARDIVESLVLYSADSPACPSQLRDTVREYLQHTRRIMLLLVRLMAHALDEPNIANMFDDIGHPLKLAHYPVDVAGTQGYGAHKDYGGFTILSQQHDAFPNQGALHVLVDDAWCVVPPRKSSLLVNAGELIQRWTNDVYKSPLHRVVLDQKRTKSRISIVFFSGPKSHTVVAPLKSLCSLESPPKYHPVNAHEWIQNKLQLNNGNTSSRD